MRSAQAFLLGTAAAGGFAACSRDFDKSTIDFSWVSGVARLDDDSFAFAIFPCSEDEISKLELTVEGLGTGTDYILFTTILRAEFDPPRSARELLISTSPQYEPPDGVQVDVLDSVALGQFNTDHDYLTSDNIKKFLTVHAWDRNGVELPIGMDLESRFDADPGELVLTDSYVNGIADVRCSGESDPAWHLPDDA